MPHLRILPGEEARLFDTPPLVAAGDRASFFKLPDASLLPLPEFRKPISHLGLVLSLGYFRYSKQFYSPETFHLGDVDYVAACLGYSLEAIDWSDYSYRMQSLHQQLIRESLGWQSFKDQLPACEAYAGQLVELYWRPRAVLKALVSWLKSQRTEVPSYHRFTQLITQHYRAWESGLMDKLAGHVTAEQTELLESLLASSATKNSQFTKWKGLSHSLRPRQIKYSVETFREMQPIITKLEPLIEVLALPASAIQYLAGWAQKATLAQMQQSR